MWCSTCQQDVPGVASPAGSGLRCSHCGQPAQHEPAGGGKLDQAGLVRLLGDLQGDDWALEAELRGVERMVGSLRATEPPAVIHPPHATPPGWNHRATQSSQDSSREAKPQSHFAAWLVLSLGLAVFACGAVLLGWSFLGERQDLWPIGMPLALIGQAGLIVGLVLQLDGLWQTNRKTASALSQLDGELASVRQATTLLTTAQASGGQSFYVHMAEGASPQLLLADLKGQLDLLAQQLATRK
jgi:hypothetical protein